MTDPADASSAGRYRRLAVALLGLGIVLRLALFAADHPLYMDEAYLALNLDRGYGALAGPLGDNQVAPLLFLWVEKTAMHLLGPDELALRLVPLAAGVAALALFWRVAAAVVPPPAAALAVGLLGMSRWPLHMAVQAKPYSFDLLASVVLLALAVSWLRDRERTRWPAVLVLAAPLALGLSFPAAFVAAGVGVVMLTVAWRSPNRGVRAWFAGFLLVTALATLAFDVWVGGRQLGRTGDGTHDFMNGYWQDAFPPSDPVALPGWLALTHIGPLTGYPYGNGAAAGLITCPLAVLGAVVLCRQGGGRVVALLLVPAAVTLSAAALHKYPYGGCTRVAQHLAPAVCLLAASGAAAVVRRLTRFDAWRFRAVAGLAVTLAVFGIGHVGHWYHHPWRDPEDYWAETVATEAAAEVGEGGHLHLPPMPESVRPGLIWYLRLKEVTPAEPATHHPAAHSEWVLSVEEETSDTKGDVSGARPAGGRSRRTIELPPHERGRCSFRATLWTVPSATSDR